MVTVYEVAAFTTDRAVGCSTGDVLDADNFSDKQMQQIASRLPYSHPVFIIESMGADYDVGNRFFTPTQEIKNCGHATIAAHSIRTHLYPMKISPIMKQKSRSGIQDVELLSVDDSIAIHFKQNGIVLSEVQSDIALSILNLSSDALHKQYPRIVATFCSTPRISKQKYIREKSTMGSHKQTNQSAGAVFLIGLALLFITGWWWPGILFLIAFANIAGGMADGREWDEVPGGLWMIGLGFIFMIGFRIELLLLLIGASMLFCPFVKKQFSMGDEEKRKNDTKRKNDDMLTEIV